MTGTMVNKTREAAYEEDIKFQSYKFEMIAKSANDVLYDWNLESNKIWWSKGWQSKFDYQNSESKIRGMTGSSSCILTTGRLSLPVKSERLRIRMTPGGAITGSEATTVSIRLLTTGAIF